MPNPLFGQFGNPASDIVSQVNRFKSQFNINPREEVQRLLNSGQMSQAQFNRFAQMAQQYAPLFKR